MVPGFLVPCYPSPRNLSGRIRLDEFVYGAAGGPRRSGRWFLVRPGMYFLGKWVFFVGKRTHLKQLTSYLRSVHVEHEILEVSIEPPTRVTNLAPQSA